VMLDESMYIALYTGTCFMQARVCVCEAVVLACPCPDTSKYQTLYLGSKAHVVACCKTWSYMSLPPCTHL
jgi:hypothetical protein